MNHIYRSVWNEITRTYVAAAEIVRGKGKGSKSSRTAEDSEAALAAGSMLTGATGEHSPPLASGPGFGGFRFMALEQRFMFDGAAVDTAISSLDHSATERPAEPAATDLLRIAAEALPQAVASSEAQVNQLIGDFLAQPQAREQLFALFNGGLQAPTDQWQGQVDAFLAAVRSGDFQINVQLLDGDTLQGAKAAFSATGSEGQPVIYLNRDWLEAGADSGSVTTVLTEELGHAIDHFLNGAADTAGDEGEAFASLLRNGQLRLEPIELDDAGIIQINGQDVAVEFASYTFVNAYKMVYDLNNDGAIVGSDGETAAEKEQSTHNFDAAGLGQVRINDGTNGQQFSGNDVSATSIVIGGQTYNGWISRPIKSGGVVRGFYFWTDSHFTSLALAQADGNMDGDSDSSDNTGFLLVVDQAWFTAQISSTATTVTTAIDNTSLRTYSRVGSSSDRVDSALNGLVSSNIAPIANSETASGTPSTTVSTAAGTAALEQGYNSNTSTVITATINGTGNVLANDSDGNSDSLSVTTVTSRSTGNAGTASSAGTAVTGKYGTLTIKSDGSWTYAPDNANATVNALLSGNVQESFTYTVSDSRGGTATATLTVQINGSNDAPVAVNDYNSAKEITSTANTGYIVEGNVLPNDSDVDSGDGKTIAGFILQGSATAGTVTNNPSTTALSFTTTESSFNTTTINGASMYYLDGSTYRLLHAADGTIITAGTAVEDTVNQDWDVPLNKQPSYYLAADGSTKVYLSTITTPWDNHSVGFKASSTSETTTTGGNFKSATTKASETTATATIALPSYSGNIAVGMTVSGPQDTVPAGTKISAISYDANRNITGITVSANVSFTTGASLSFSTTATAGQTIQGTHGTLTLSSTGAYTYTPTTDNPNLSSGQSAIEVFDYTMQDTAGVTSAAKLYITVYGSGSNDPVLISDTGTAVESGVQIGGNATAAGSDATGNVLANDKESYAAASNVIGTGYVYQVGRDGSGSFTTIDTNNDGRTSTNSATVSGLYGNMTINDLGAYTYAITNTNPTVEALLPGQSLTETFSYQVKNALSPAGTSWAKLTITLQGTNDRPTAVADTGTLTEDVDLSASGNVLTNDTDVDAGDTKVVSQAGTSSANTAVTAGTTSVNGLAIGGTYGLLTIGADGTYQYVLATASDATRYAALQALTSGSTGTETFTYEVKDTNSATHTATLTFTINGANEAPVNAFNGTAISSTGQTSVTTAVNTALDFTGTNLISVTDADVNLSSVTLTVEHGVLSFTTAPSGLTLNGATLSAASGTTLTLSGTQQQINDALALLRYTPDNNFAGTDFLSIASKDSLGARDSDGIAILIPKNTSGTVDEAALSTGSNAASTAETIASASLGLPSGQTVNANQSGTASYGTWSVNKLDARNFPSYASKPTAHAV